MRKGDKLMLYRDTNIYYTESGEVFFYDERITCSEINDMTGYEEFFQPMRFDGYEKRRDALRYEYDGKTYRIKIKDNPRVFNTVARSSKKFKKLYNTRNGIIAVSTETLVSRITRYVE